MDEKKELRKKLVASRQALPDADKRERDEAIAEAVFFHLAEKEITSLGVYLPIRGEPVLAELYERLAGIVELSLPVTNEDKTLAFMRWQPGEALEEGAFGIPVPAKRINAGMPQALLIPCVGFTPEKYRLGYGGGFFDRTLAGVTGVYRIGIAYSFARTSFAAGEYDIPMDCVITENEIVF